MDENLDNVATGGELPESRLRIAGRPRPGTHETYALCEEPGSFVLTHYRREAGGRVPHFKKDCPHCLPTDRPEPFWYVGAQIVGARRLLVILELTRDCFETAEAEARRTPLRGPTLIAAVITSQPTPPAVFMGLVVQIHRPNFDRSPRYVRCMGRAEVKIDWPYETRRELARIWNVPVRPRLFNQEQA